MPNKEISKNISDMLKMELYPRSSKTHFRSCQEFDTYISNVLDKKNLTMMKCYPIDIGNSYYINCILVHNDRGYPFFMLFDNETFVINTETPRDVYIRVDDISSDKSIIEDLAPLEERFIPTFSGIILYDENGILLSMGSDSRKLTRFKLVKQMGTESYHYKMYPLIQKSKYALERSKDINILLNGFYSAICNMFAEQIAYPSDATLKSCKEITALASRINDKARNSTVLTQNISNERSSGEKVLSSIDNIFKMLSVRIELNNTNNLLEGIRHNLSIISKQCDDIL